MFTLLGRTCSRCGGCLTDEWKLDLEKEREVVCLNCGSRTWERFKRRGRPPKNTSQNSITKITAESYTKTETEGKKWRRSRVKKDVNDSFNDETHRQILKRQSENRKKRRKPVRKRLPGMSSKWLEV